MEELAPAGMSLKARKRKRLARKSRLGRWSGRISMARRCGRVGRTYAPLDAGRVQLSASPTRVLMPPVLVPPNSSGKGTGGIDARRLYVNEIEEPEVSARVKPQDSRSLGESP